MTLTIQDLDEIEKIVEEKVDEKTINLPTRDEFFGKMDEVMGELKAMREEHKLLSQRVYQDHEPRIEKVEKKLNISSTA